MPGGTSSEAEMPNARITDVDQSTVDPGHDSSE